MNRFGLFSHVESARCGTAVPLAGSQQALQDHADRRLLHIGCQEPNSRNSTRNKHCLRLDRAFITGAKGFYRVCRITVRLSVCLGTGQQFLNPFAAPSCPWAHRQRPLFPASWLQLRHLSSQSPLCVHREVSHNQGINEISKACASCLLLAPGAVVRSSHYWEPLPDVVSSR